MTLRLDEDAYNLLLEFFFEVPDLLFSEIEEHGINPFYYPDEFITSELQESEHSDILELALENRGVVTVDMIEDWIEEELEEEGEY